MAPKRGSRASSVASDTKKVTKVTKTATSKAAKSKTTAAKNAAAKKVVVDQTQTTATPRPSTRASRRLRASEDPEAEASPLRMFTPEKRTRKTKTTPSPEPEQEKEETPETSSEEGATSSREGSLETIDEQAQALTSTTTTNVNIVESVEDTPLATVEETETITPISDVIEMLDDTPAATELEDDSHSIIELLDDTPSVTVEETETTASESDVIEMLDDTPTATETMSDSHSVIELLNGGLSTIIEETEPIASESDVIEMLDDTPAATEAMSDSHSVIELLDDTPPATIAAREEVDFDADDQDNTFNRMCNESIAVDDTEGALYTFSNLLGTSSQFNSPMPVQKLHHMPPAPEEISPAQKAHDMPPSPVQKTHDIPPALEEISPEQVLLEEQARKLVPTGERRRGKLGLSDEQWEHVRIVFAEPSLEPHIPSIAEFENEAASQSSDFRRDRQEKDMTLRYMIDQMTDEEKATVIIAQRQLLLKQHTINANANAKIDTQRGTISDIHALKQSKKQELNVMRREKEELQRQNEELEQNFESELLKEREEIEQKAQEEVERLEREEQENLKLAASSSKKRPAPEEDDEEDERPSRRVKLTESASPSANGQTGSQDDSHKRTSSSSSSRLSTIQEASPSREATMEEPTQPQTPPTASRRFLSGVVSSVTNMFPIKRFFGNTPQAPRTEPVRRVLKTVAPSKSNAITPVRYQATVASPSSSTDGTPSRPEPKRRASSDYLMSGALESAADIQEPETPSSGITKEHFVPQTAPQPRRNFAPPGATPRKTYREKLATMTALAKKREAAANTARAEAVIAENNRNKATAKETAKEIRRKSFAAIEATQKPGEKRKIRVDDLEVIPGLGPGRVGVPEAFVYASSDDSSDEESKKQEIERPQAPPAKRVRFSEPETPSTKRPWTDGSCFGKVSPHIKTPIPSMSSDPHRAQPYTGTMFADKTSKANVFDQSVNRDNIKQSPLKTTSEDSLDSVNNTKQTPLKTTSEDSLDSVNNTNQSPQEITSVDRLDPVAYGKKYGVWIGPKVSSIPRPAGFNYAGHFSVPDDSDSETELEDSEVKTPEKPTIQPNVIALEKARNDAEKYKPKTPSGLRATSKLSSSPFDSTPTKAPFDITPTKAPFGITSTKAPSDSTPTKEPSFNVLGAGATPGMELKKAAAKADLAMTFTPAPPATPTPATLPAVANVPLPTWSLPAPKATTSLVPTQPQQAAELFGWQWPAPPESQCTDPEVLAAVQEKTNSPLWPLYCKKLSGGIWADASKNIPKKKDAPPPLYALLATDFQGEPLGRMPLPPRASRRT